MREKIKKKTCIIIIIIIIYIYIYGVFSLYLFIFQRKLRNSRHYNRLKKDYSRQKKDYSRQKKDYSRYVGVIQYGKKTLQKKDLTIKSIYNIILVWKSE